jgi:hypothetical protein
MVQPVLSSRSCRSYFGPALCVLVGTWACAATDQGERGAPLQPLPESGVVSAFPTAMEPGNDASVPAVVSGLSDAGVVADAGVAADAAAAPDTDARPNPPRPIDGGNVPGPITGKNPPFSTTHVDAAAHGFVEDEFFLEGSAASYTATGSHGLDGKWDARPDAHAAYKTRLIVRRPREASAFNGTVFIEWLNVTRGRDAEVAYSLASEELLRGGYGYVGVSVQSAGVDALKSSDAERYGTLTHPGDAYAYDIYAQAGAAIGWPRGVDPLGGLHAARLIAYGESQSAMRMITFVNAVHPLAGIFDAFIVHSRGGWGAAVGTESDSLLGDGTPVHVREDLSVPVLQFFTESEVVLPLGPTYASRQPDSPKLRTWEVAGTAHADQHMLGKDADMGCGTMNDGQQHVVAKAAFRAMHHWLKDGVAPPSGTPLMVDTQKSTLLRDEFGNALGGIRTPAVDAPIATLTGEASGLALLNPLCMLFGQTTPFKAERLQKLYPSHGDYVDAVSRAAHAARTAGFALPEEEEALIAEAKAAQIPR